MQAESKKPEHSSLDGTLEIGLYMDTKNPVTHLVFVGKESSIIYNKGIGTDKCEVEKPEDGAEICAYFEDGSFHLEIEGRQPCKGTATIKFDDGQWHRFNYEILES